MKKVRKAVIPAAGLGTRFLPITKAVPKEMLPIVDKPALQYIIEEFVASGIRDILIVTGRGKRCIEDHFDMAPELDGILEHTGKNELLEISKQISSLANIHYVRQKQALGLGHAVLCAKSFVGDEPFALALGDDLIYTPDGVQPCAKQLIDCYEKTGLSTIATMKVESSEVKKYGNVGFSKKDGKIGYVDKIVEKPDEKEMLSNDVIIGRYVVTPDIFEEIEKTKPSKCGEIYFTDALEAIAKKTGLCAYEFDGVRYDTGDKLGYLKANTEYALRDENLGKGYAEYLKKIVETLD